jgi:molybdate transport system substrate-binding protein
MLSRLATGVVLGAALVLSGCGSGAKPANESTKPPAPGANQPRELSVMAAASLTESFRELGQQFEAENPGVKVACSFAGSQQLLVHLQNGAKADVFASASAKEMDEAFKSGLVAADGSKVFARNRLVVVVSRTAKTQPANLDDLAKPGVRLVLADKSVPVGRYSLQVLDKLAAEPARGESFKKAVEANIVSYENNVKAVFAKVRLGEADAGIVYATDVAKDSAAQVVVLEIPAACNQTAVYPLAVLQQAPQPELARKFIEMVLSEKGQRILAGRGFLSAKDDR